MKMYITLRFEKGYTFVELVVVIIIIGILASVAMKSLGEAVDISRTEETKKEMERLAFAIAGNPNLTSGGIRTDYGYIGDIGALPPDWDALVINPGSYSTWNGPYIQDKFAASAVNNDYKSDGWGIVYSSPATSFSSTGGTTTITRQIGNSIDKLLYNRVRLSITDLDFNTPGSVNKDSVRFILTHPNGAGANISKSGFPDAGGYFEIDSIPIGIHTLQVAFLPQNDTLKLIINISPGQDYYADLQYYEDIW
jgi:prepilin-type N-terminal cleavage/methylation domain-containing protein